MERATNALPSDWIWLAFLLPFIPAIALGWVLGNLAGLAMRRWDDHRGV